MKKFKKAIKKLQHNQPQDEELITNDDLIVSQGEAIKDGMAVLSRSSLENKYQLHLAVKALERIADDLNKITNKNNKEHKFNYHGNDKKNTDNDFDWDHFLS